MGSLLPVEAMSSAASKILDLPYTFSCTSSLGVPVNGAIQGWDRAAKHQLPTLTRSGDWEPWGLTVTCGEKDIMENGGRWSGIAVHRNQSGMWAKVNSIQSDSPAGRSGIRSHDFIKRINGRLVFHMTPAEVDRLINSSGNTLFLDIERNPSKRLVYDSGVNERTLQYLLPSSEDSTKRPGYQPNWTYPSWRHNLHVTQHIKYTGIL